MNFRKKLIISIISFFIFGQLAAQNPIIDSLNQVLETEVSPLKQADIHRQLARQLVNYDPVKALENSAKALEIARKQGDKESLARSLQVQGGMLAITGQFNKALDSLLYPALELARELNLKGLEAETLNSCAGVYMYQGKSAESLKLFNQAIALFDSLGIHDKKARTQLNTGSIYSTMGDYQRAITVSFEALRFFEEQKDSALFGHIYNNIAVHYDNWGNPDDALKYYTIALAYLDKMGNNYQKSATLNNIGEIYRGREQYDTAFVYYEQAIEIAKNMGDPQLLAVPTLSSGELYTNRGENRKALEYTEKALKLFQQLGFAEGIARAYGNLGKTYKALGQNTPALDYYNKSIEKAIETDISDLLLSNYKGLAELWEQSGNDSKALHYYKTYSNLKDSVFTDEKSRQIEELQTQYETDKKEQQIIVQQAKIEKNEAEIARKNARQRMLLALLAAVFITIVVFAIGYYEKRKANIKISRQRDEIQQKNNVLEQQKEEIRAQADHLAEANEQILMQKEKLEESHRHITDSINYASRIQEALLPSKNLIDHFMPQNFILWKPRDVVSGDFYWARAINNHFLVAVADCTGHGVPGAFVSMLGIAFLNEIVRKGNVKTAADVLNQLRDEVKASLKQNTDNKSVNDGMDISFCEIDPKNNTLQFAGAHNSLLLFRKSENAANGYQMFEYKADRMPVSTYIRERSFTNYAIELQDGDRLYMFSDGFSDQIGGPKGQKFFKKRLKTELKDIQTKSMDEQKTFLENMLDDWMQDNYKQVDDILLMGLEYQSEKNK